MNKEMKIRLCTLVLFYLCYAMPGLTQQPEDTSNKQAIYANLGSVIFENQLSINFERLLFASAPRLETRLKFNAGTYLSNNYDYDISAEIYSNYLSASILQLIPIGRVQFELNIGLARTQFTTIEDSERRSKFRAYTLAGLRYGKDDLLVRLGFGNFELFHLGVGYQF